MLEQFVAAGYHEPLCAGKVSAMREEFLVTGHFYMTNGYKFRKTLDICTAGNELGKPDLMVVMMNPGSSRPVNGVDDSRTSMVAIPDKTQDQIMKVMITAGFEYARVLNLSDLRTSNSNELYEFLQSSNSNMVEHSIFHPGRESEYAELFVNNVPVIYAWGVHEALKPLALAAIRKIEHPNPAGWKKKGSSYGYYHPLPPSTPKQVEWVERITGMLSGT